MSEWHLSPDYIVTHWTDELFNLMVEKLTERKKGGLGKGQDEKVEDKDLFKLAGNLIKVEKSGD